MESGIPLDCHRMFVSTANDDLDSQAAKKGYSPNDHQNNGTKCLKGAHIYQASTEHQRYEGVSIPRSY